MCVMPALELPLNSSYQITHPESLINIVTSHQKILQQLNIISSYQKFLPLLALSPICIPKVLLEDTPL